MGTSLLPSPWSKLHLNSRSPDSNRLLSYPLHPRHCNNIRRGRGHRSRVLASCDAGGELRKGASNGAAGAVEVRVRLTDDAAAKRSSSAVHAYHQRVPLPDPTLAVYHTVDHERHASPHGPQWRVKELLADPAALDLEIAATAGGNTLLHVATASGHADLASLLLRRAPCLLAAHLDTPVHLVVRAGAHKVVDLLVASSSSSSPACSLRSLTRATNRRCTTPCRAAMRPRCALVAADPGLVELCGGAGESHFYMTVTTGLEVGSARVCKSESYLSVMGST